MFSAVPFYRHPSNERARCEDRHVICDKKKVALVADGVSKPYVGEPEDYGGGKSSGEVVSQIICDTITFAHDSVDLPNLLHQGNEATAKKHCAMGRDLTREAVAGASVAACQVQDDQVSLLTVGDSSIFWEYETSFDHFSNFTPSATAMEEEGNEFFEACKRYGAIVGAAPWQLYHPFFQAKQFYRANRHVGGRDEPYKPGINGGHGMVNGNPDLVSCWSTRSISLAGLKWILLVTDGMLWRDFRPESHCQLVVQTFNLGGIPALLGLRDALDNQPHIKGWPEGTAIVLKFK